MPARYRHSILAVAGLLTLALAGMHHLAGSDATAGPPLVLSSASPEPRPVMMVAALAPLVTTTEAMTMPRSPAGFAAMDQLARRDPWALARRGRQRYEHEIRDYTCVFLKQERIGGKLRQVEEIEVRYREEPKTVYMIWKRNASQAKRVLFEDAPEFVNEQGQKLAHVEPAGALIRLIVSDILMPIHGKRARESSRRFIDEFGFCATLGLLDRYNQLAVDRGVLDVRYAGEGEVDGRPTYKIVRYLPYEGPDGTWPDAKMVMHLDQEWLLPTAVYSYANREGTELLGSYVHTQVKLNPNLDDSAFEF